MMIAFYKKLMGLWKKEPLNQNNVTETGNSLSIMIDNNNEPYVKISITNTSTDAAICFSDTINDLVNGLYTESIFQTLKNLSNQDEAIHHFYNIFMTRSLIIQGSKKLTLASKDSEPQVRPTSFFRMTKNNEQ